ncbi:MAG: arginine--tRNA ligase [Parcubacteria group bacterium]|jgi:arginyl-tRNA synthetase
MKIQELKEKIIERLGEAIKKTTGAKLDDLSISFPSNPEFGDFAFECFSLAKKLEKSPVEISKLIAANFKPDEIIEKVSATGSYLNIRLTNTALFSVLEEVLDKKYGFGSSEIGKKEKVMVEYLGPNTNKPLHLGHARNGSLGMALTNILKHAGYDTLRANIINDRGVHICKSMLAYQKWGENSTPESLQMKGDHFVGHWYVKYSQELANNPELENEIQEMLKEWEDENKEIIELWKKMNDWVYEGWKTTLLEMGFEFDVVNYESKTYKLGKDIINAGLQKGVFEKNENGAIIFNLSEKEFSLDKDGNAKKITLVRDDGTSVYITQDLGTAVSRIEKYALDKLIYVVGSEQVYHFQCLFKILESLGYKWAKNLYHLSYGMITLPDGKMKSREGKVVDADDLIKKIKELAKEEIQKRYGEEKINETDFEERVRKIALGAIKFYFLRVGASQNIEFNPKESVSFDGFTGPYCQYAYARIASILRKAEPIEKNINFEALGNNQEERELIKKIIGFPDLIKKSALEYNPSIVAIDIFEIAQLFNKFYQKYPVLNAETEDLKSSRLALIQAIQIVLKVGLNLLGIETLEKM